MKFDEKERLLHYYKKNLSFTKLFIKAYWWQILISVIGFVMFFTSLFSNHASPKTKWDWVLLLVGLMMVGTGVSYLYLEDIKKMKHLLLSHLGIWGGLSLVIISFIIGVQTNRNGTMLLIIPGLVLLFAGLFRKNVVEKRYAITYVDPFEHMRENRFNGLMNFLRSELRVTTAQEIDFVLDEITEDSNRSSWKWDLGIRLKPNSVK
jgi:CDP-diglyceride synthetase